MTPRLTATAALVAALVLPALAGTAMAQTAAPPASTEVSNFGAPADPGLRIVLTGPEQRATWRALEDRQLGDRRRLEDRLADELRNLMRQQAEERDALLRTLPR